MKISLLAGATLAGVSLLAIVAIFNAGLQIGRIFEHAEQPPSRVFTPPNPPTPVEVAPEPKAPLAEITPGFRDKLKKATVSLYADMGGVRFICTATAIQKLPTGYVFLTARHCVASDEPRFIVVSLDADSPYVRATPAIVGSYDTDAALLTAPVPDDLPVIPIGTEKLVSDGSRVEYFGFPQNLGKLYFEGYISSTKIGPPAYPEPQWNGDLGVTIQIGPGSSGSALVDPNQEAIIGVVTGLTFNRGVGGVILSMATPASKVRQLVDDYKSGRVRAPVRVGLFDNFRF